ncbi:indole-3-glycerol phosphate synthase TrpC [Kineosporia mesophila]|uniref:Indole-3-glycerol phosphate synthase n=1 Tax=Kineosporia mesophila TaxID=566012 RepID=A0ABP7AAP0_9ACTN|nr:indole-3-glycerol phosphate synthase TrpC [Kineosporia mesophila]MCD5351408.1 indole-3-glycerol phosphate synthase TrpC [Kineosporia mesophila]
MNVLQRIREYKLDELAAARREEPEAGLLSQAHSAGAVRGFAAALTSSAQQPALIAEVKKASPSQGLIREHFDPGALALSYERAGAGALSVLTDGPSFAGTREHLVAARSATSLPVLRKDFLFDPYQVVQSRAWGADCVLVILAVVDDSLGKDLIGTALDLGLDVIVEVHDEDELSRAVALRAPIIGVNNRDLHTFHTTLATTERLAAQVPPDRLLVGESGIATPQDVSRMRDAGCTAILVGESLLRQDDVEAATRALLAST